MPRELFGGDSLARLFSDLSSARANAEDLIERDKLTFQMEDLRPIDPKFFQTARDMAQAIVSMCDERLQVREPDLIVPPQPLELPVESITLDTPTLHPVLFEIEP